MRLSVPWIFTLLGLTAMLYQARGAGLEILTTIPSVPSQQLPVIVPDHGQSFWIATTNGLELFDFKVPHQPKSLAKYSELNPILCATLQGQWMFVGGSTLDIVNLNDPTQPTRVARHASNFPIQWMATAEQRLYCYLENGDLSIFDISNPQDLSERGRIKNFSLGAPAFDGTFLFTARPTTNMAAYVDKWAIRPDSQLELKSTWEWDLTATNSQCTPYGGVYGPGGVRVRSSADGQIWILGINTAVLYTSQATNSSQMQSCQPFKSPLNSLNPATWSSWMDVRPQNNLWGALTSSGSFVLYETDSASSVLDTVASISLSPWFTPMNDARILPLEENRWLAVAPGIGVVVLQINSSPGLQITETTAPESQTIPWKESIALGIKAHSIAPLSYQWYHNGQHLVGETNDSLHITSAQRNHQGTYQVSASTPGGRQYQKFRVFVDIPVHLMPPTLNADGSLDIPFWGADGEEPQPEELSFLTLQWSHDLTDTPTTRFIPIEVLRKEQLLIAHVPPSVFARDILVPPWQPTPPSRWFLKLQTRPIWLYPF